MAITGLKRRLKKLHRRLRIAFATFCVEHVLPAFEVNYNEPYEKQPHAAVNLAWRFATGEDLPKETVMSAEEELGALMKVMSESRQVLDSAIDVCRAALYLLDAIIDPTEDESANHAFRAVNFAHEAVQYFEDYAGPGSTEELELQEKALQLAESWESQPIRDDMFSRLPSTYPPTWLSNRL